MHVLWIWFVIFTKYRQEASLLCRQSIEGYFMTSSAIVTEGLWKRYRSQVAVCNLSFSVPKGSVVGLLGPNGSGKSTLFRVLMGLTRPTSGQVRVLGLDPIYDGERFRSLVGYVPEKHCIYPWMTVAEVIDFSASLYPTWNSTIASSLVKQYALDGRKRVRWLSKGMAVKLSLLLALSHDPELLLMDEPTSGLDPLVRDELISEVRRSSASFGRTILFSSHVISEVDAIADTIGVMSDGMLIEYSRRDDLIGRFKEVRCILQDNTAMEPPLLDAALFQRSENMCSWIVAGSSQAVAQELATRQGVGEILVSDLSLEVILKHIMKSANSMRTKA